MYYPRNVINISFSSLFSTALYVKLYLEYHAKPDAVMYEIWCENMFNKLCT